MTGCPDCDARRKAQEARDLAIAEQKADERRSSEFMSDYCAGIIVGGIAFGLPAEWIFNSLGGPNLVFPAMWIGVSIGVTFVYWKRDQLGRGKS